MAKIHRSLSHTIATSAPANGAKTNSNSRNRNAFEKNCAPFFYIKSCSNAHWASRPCRLEVIVAGQCWADVKHELTTAVRVGVASDKPVCWSTVWDATLPVRKNVAPAVCTLSLGPYSSDKSRQPSLPCPLSDSPAHRVLKVHAPTTSLPGNHWQPTRRTRHWDRLP